MRYPGHLIKAGEADVALVEALAAELRRRGYALARPSRYDAALAATVRQFQAQHGDLAGRPLAADGEVGPLTWGALFGGADGDGEHDATAKAVLGPAALAIARGQIGVTEAPPGSNRGPMVDRYLAAAGLAPGASWCMAFVVWCFAEAAARLGIVSPCPATGGCLDAWRKARAVGARAITRAEALARPALVRPGQMFVLDHGGGLGHAGLVRANRGGALATIEGNANAGGGREGTGVCALDRRGVADAALVGFLDFDAIPGGRP